MDESVVDYCSNNRLSAQTSSKYERQHEYGERSKRRKCHGNRQLQRLRRRCRAQAFKDHVASPSRLNFNAERMDTTTSGPSTEV